MKILIAEDDQNISTIMELTLEQIGNHKVTNVENGQLAIDELKKSTFDLIILDGMMPVKDGMQACKEIKEELCLSTPVIFLTAKTDDKSVSEFLNLGAIGVIGKPFDISTICEQIDGILASKDGFAC